MKVNLKVHMKINMKILIIILMKVNIKTHIIILAKTNKIQKNQFAFVDQEIPMLEMKIYTKKVFKEDVILNIKLKKKNQNVYVLQEMQQKT